MPKFGALSKLRKGKKGKGKLVDEDKFRAFQEAFKNRSEARAKTKKKKEKKKD